MKASENKEKISKFFAKQAKDFKRDWQLHIIMLLPIVYVIIFRYMPLYGIQIAFRDFKLNLGISGSPWVGLKWFNKFLTNYNFKEILGNTITLSLYTIVVGFPLPVIFALLLNAVRNERLKKITQTVSYIPHFISVTVIVAIITLLFDPLSGLYGNLYRALGGTTFPKDFRNTSDAFRHIYVWSDVWQEIGWGAIIYIAALSGVDPQLHEAAQIDGASRFKRILHVDLPAIMPTVCIMLILRFGSVMSIGFEKVYLMQSSLNLSTSEVISTYVYKKGLNSPNNYSYGTAVSLFDSVINCIMLILVNWTSKRLSKNEVSLL